ncbi:hypothetical protein Tco_1511743 [Tanacetum coccineum]
MVVLSKPNAPYGGAWLWWQRLRWRLSRGHNGDDVAMDDDGGDGGDVFGWMMMVRRLLCRGYGGGVDVVGEAVMVMEMMEWWVPPASGRKLARGGAEKSREYVCVVVASINE